MLGTNLSASAFRFGLHGGFSPMQSAARRIVTSHPGPWQVESPRDQVTDIEPTAHPLRNQDQ